MGRATIYMIPRCFAFWTVMLLISMLAAGCKKREVQIERPPPLVIATDAIARDAPLYLDEIGTCTAREVVSVRPQATGRITAIHFVDGADLKKGNPLFTIDPRPY